MSEIYPNAQAPLNEGDLNNWNTDRSVVYPVMVRGNMWKTSGGSWVYDSKPSSFQISTVTMATAGTDYSCLVPQDTKMIEMQIRGVNGYMVSCATISAVSANDYFTLYDTQSKNFGGPGCNFDEQSLWFCGDSDDMVIELTVYK